MGVWVGVGLHCGGAMVRKSEGEGARYPGFAQGCWGRRWSAVEFDRRDFIFKKGLG